MSDEIRCKVCINDAVSCSNVGVDRQPNSTGRSRRSTHFGSRPRVESQTSLLTDVVDVQRYNRSIHIMVMLLGGFGFLMVFVKKYGLSAVTATYLLVSTAIPLYMLIKS